MFNDDLFKELDRNSADADSPLRHPERSRSSGGARACPEQVSVASASNGDLAGSATALSAQTPKKLPEIRRRAFITTSLATLAGLALWQLRKTTVVQVVNAAGGPKEVTIVQFSDAGERLQTVTIQKVVKTDAEWRKQLDSNTFDITRRADTELAYTGKYWNVHDKGLYRCICCDNALFDSATKFDSGTGWPSFWQPIAKENVRQIADSSLGMDRIAVACTECDAHLGHVFDDGPRPTGLRYCMNSASLRFVKRA